MDDEMLTKRPHPKGSNLGFLSGRWNSQTVGSYSSTHVGVKTQTARRQADDCKRSEDDKVSDAPVLYLDKSWGRIINLWEGVDTILSKQTGRASAHRTHKASSESQNLDQS